MLTQPLFRELAAGSVCCQGLVVIHVPLKAANEAW